MDKLAHIRTLSKIAAKDAGFVTESIYGEKEKGIFLSQNLYVTRTIETEIFTLLETPIEEDLSFLLISGEAGFGKTSLLWHLYQTLDNNIYEIWFIKSTFLTPFVSDSKDRDSYGNLSHLSVSALLTAVEAAKHQEKIPLVLLDTVDLLLHNEGDRENLLTLISELRACGCKVIASSRPQEAFHLRAHVDHLEGLQAYDDKELEVAVSNHVHCFYERADAREMDEHLQRILGGVSNGLQIREVCTNPLTLRMLFTLYAPEEVPLEINTFQLYQKFWELRVTSDHRGGSSYCRGEDLGNAASIIALSMLVEGKPELSNKLMEHYLKEWHGSSNDLTMLISRGIIHRSEDNTNRFFHQTFFEHCAARGLLLKFKQQAILLLQDRMKSTPNDLFVSPIMEQTLLLAEDESRQLRSAGDEALLELLNSNHQLLKTSGIYVYIHRRMIDDKIEILVGNLLSGGDNVVLNRFLNLAPNMPQSNSRCKILFKELEIAWQADTTEARNLVLELLERLASRYPDYVEKFLKSQGILDFSPQQWNLGFKRILNIMVLLFRHFPSSRQKELVQQLLRSLRKEGSDALSNRIMETLLSLSRLSHFSTLADECETVLMEKGDKVKKIRKTVLAKLFYFQWKVAGTPIETILAGLKKENKEYFFKARLRAFSELLLIANREDATKAWSYFIGETDDFKKWMWAHMVIPKLIDGFSDEPFEYPKLSSPQSGTAESVLFFREKIKEELFYWSTTSPPMSSNTKKINNRLDTFKKIRKAIILSETGKTMLLDLIDVPALAEPSPWCDPDFWGELLADAYDIGQPGAVRALQLLVNRIENFSEKLVGLVGYRLLKSTLKDESTIVLIFNFFLKTRNAALMQQFFELKKTEIQAFIPCWKDYLDNLLRQLAVSKKNDERRKSLSLWIYISNLCHEAIPSVEYLASLLKNERVNSICGMILTLLAQRAIAFHPELDNIIDILLTYSTHKDENLRINAINAMLSSVFSVISPPAYYVEKLLNVVLFPPVKGKLVNRFFREITNLPPGEDEFILRILKQLIVGCNEHLKHNAKQELYNDMIKPVRKVLRFLPIVDIKQLLELVPRVEQYMGRLIVDAVCYENFMQLVPELDRLLEHPHVPGRVKESIRRHKYNRERTLGGEGWPELENLLSTGFHTKKAGGNSQGKRIPQETPTGHSDASHMVRKIENSFEQKTKILFLSANQVGTGRLFSEREYREIDNVLMSAKYRYRFELKPKLAVRYIDIRQALLEYEPHILHFSGHGTEEGLMIMDEVGVFSKQMSTEAIKRLFSLFARSLKCVVLSSCYSEHQANEIVQYIPYVIGMREGIEDNAAIEFAKGFYATLGAGRSIEDSFQMGRLEIFQSFPDISQDLIPILKKKEVASDGTNAAGNTQFSGFVFQEDTYQTLAPKARVDLVRLPAHTVPKFVGRDHAIDELVQLFGTPNANIVSLVGFGGVGKSALIAAFLDKIAPGYGQAEQVIGWSFYSQGSHETSASSHIFFEEAIRFLDPHGSIPIEDSGRVTRLLELLRTKRSLLILDGLEPLQKPPNIDGGRIRDRSILWLLTDIARNGINGLVLVSSRQPLVELNRYSESYKEIKVEDLPPEAGAALIRSIGVKGEEDQLFDASRAFGGNALALVLLANLLVSRYKGAVGYWKTLPVQALETEQGGQSRRILSYYNNMWLNDSHEKILLWCMSLVERPLDYSELAAVQSNTGFAARLPQYGSPEFNQLIYNLKRAGILSRQEPVLECHPMIRTYFSLTFEQDFPKEYIEAHRVLFEYFINKPNSRFPESLGEMEPLYRSIRHGCIAGKSQEAFQVYYKQIQHNDSSYSLYRLGAFDTDLSALANFFPDGWAGKPVPGLNPEQANDILTTASYCLLSLARMEEAIHVLYLKLNWAISNKDLLLASSLYENLVESLTQYGHLQEAEDVAQKAIETLSTEFSTDQMVEAYADQAYVTLYRGSIDAACDKYRKIEKNQPAHRRPLSGYAGFQYCEALLAQSAIENAEETLQRATGGIKIARSEKMLLHRALYGLIKGRALLLLGQRANGIKTLLLAERHAKEAGSEETLAFVLASAGLAILKEKATANDCRRARRWLDEAALIAENRKMTLINIDVKIGFAKLAFLSGDRESALSIAGEANTLIEETGYYLARYLHSTFFDSLSG